MKMQSGFKAAFLLIVILSIVSCKQKDDPVVPAATGSMKFEFSNLVGNSPLILSTPLDTQWYVNAAMDSFQVTTYKYYISNIVLKTADGKTYTEPESYHLINHEDLASRKFTINNVPIGDYTSVTFMIGVDSLHNTTGAQAGDLDPGLGMIWTWNTGYIMAKMEGIANTSPRIANAFALHIAGFSGFYNVLKTKTLSFPDKAVVTGSNIPNVHIFSDVQEWFKTPAVISFAQYNEVTSTGAKAKQVADNYEDMFHVDHIDN